MGFLGDILGTKNKFQADKAKLDTTAYAPTIAAGQAQATDNTKFNNVFGQQQNLAGQYGQVAAGQGPNPAKEMLRQQTGQNVNMAQGQAASQRGVNPALAARMAVDASSGQNQQAAGQGATMQAQQSLAAMGQQAGVLGQMQQGANTQQGLGNNLLATAGGLQNQQNNSNIQNTLGTNQINAGVASQNAATNAAMVGGLMDAAGGAMAMSDERVKTDIHRQQTEALPGVPEATFRYKGLPGQYRGVIAQDVQEERPDLVEEGQDGFLRVDPRLAPERMAQGGLIPGYTDGGMVPQAEMPEMNMDFGGLVPAMAGGGLAPEPVSPLHGYLDSLEAQTQPQGFAMGGMPQAQPGFFMEEPSMAPAPVAPAPAPAAAPPAAAPAKKPKMTSFSNLGAAGTSAFDRFARMPLPQAPAGMAEGGEVPAETPPYRGFTPQYGYTPGQEEYQHGLPLNLSQPWGYADYRDGKNGEYGQYDLYNRADPQVAAALGRVAEGHYFPPQSEAEQAKGSVVLDPARVGLPSAKGGATDPYMDIRVKSLQAYPPVGLKPDPAFEARIRAITEPKKKMADGGPVPMNFVGGGHVPGQAQVQGDSGKNDTVPALLSPGEAVVPRTIMQSDNPPAQAAAFIEHLLRRRGGDAFGKVVEARGGRKMAEGGEVKPTTGGAGQEGANPSLTAAVTGWWEARGTPEQEQHGRNVDEALNALLPSMVSGRKALQAKRASLKSVDTQTQE